LKAIWVVIGVSVLLSGTAWAHRRDDVVVIKNRRHHRDDVVIVRDRPRHPDVVIVREPVVRHREVIVTSPVIVSSPVVVASPSFSTTTFSIAAPIRLGDTVVDVGFSTTHVHSNSVVVSPFGSTVVRSRCR
jgi:hypothetical protein